MPLANIFQLNCQLKLTENRQISTDDVKRMDQNAQNRLESQKLEYNQRQFENKQSLIKNPPKKALKVFFICL